MREGGGFHLSYKELLAGKACEGGGFIRRHSQVLQKDRDRCCDQEGGAHRVNNITLGGGYIGRGGEWTCGRRRMSVSEI